MFPVYLKEPDSDPPNDPIYYLVAGNGIFLVKNHPLFHSKTPVTEIPWLPAEQAGFTFKGPCLPKELLARVLAFFMAVWQRYQAESIVVIYFSPANQTYEIVVPKQTVGGIHCAYEEVPGERLDDIRAGTMHSHGREDAFHSDRDNADERFQDGVHLIFGNLDTIPTLLCSAMIDGRRFPLQPKELIEGTPACEDLTQWREWAEQQIEEYVTPLQKPIYFGA